MKRFIPAFLPFVTASLFYTSPVFAKVDYQLTIAQGEHHLGNVSAEFPSGSEQLIVKLPSWRTGRYELLDMANGIRLFSAQDESGNALNWQKIDSNSWQINTTPNQKVKISYQVYANELGMRSRHIDDSHAFIDASGFFMFSEAYRDQKVTVDLKVPTDWRSVSGMENGEHAHQFVADNYDILVDSPIETGINKLFKWQVDDRDYELVVWGEGNYDTDKMITDLKKLVKTGSDIWHAYPYKRYVFMVHATSGARGATEHLNSTIIQRQRDSFRERDDYIGFITTASHEFVHTWNVKGYRPQGLTPYNYTDHNYTDLLWVAEGSTSYFDDLLLIRGDIITLKEYFKGLSKNINKHLARPGRDIQSASETSFDKWINQGGDHDTNFSTNIYSEGALLSWALDVKLISDSNGDVSYRDVHRALYQDFALPKGFSSGDVKAILKAVSGNDYTAWWQQNIDSPATLNFDDMLNTVGLKFDYPKSVSFKASADLNGDYKDGQVFINKVKREGSAWKAGLTTSDIIVAINGKRISEPFDKYLKRFKPGQSIDVSYFRRDTLHSTKLVLSEKASSPKVISLVKKPSRKQKALFKAWLGVDYPKSL
ncbi:PDZ domain-containing protein [Pseudoalteromonas sp. MMG024]|uniref:M61 family metallopeptidase n=1 Tax=Pseudoalteromonas sp. MMG024 TaxID=2909980 RepID=UPI001F01BC0A|nr:PDZ domain-containing protein [Pseudoalteromonas sp. MMG024]MCF6456604.1 PDZ domain-containing protein [Pseudoalteromonas sp. MMG024]